MGSPGAISHRCFRGNTETVHREVLKSKRMDHDKRNDQRPPTANEEAIICKRQVKNRVIAPLVILPLLLLAAGCSSASATSPNASATRSASSMSASAVPSASSTFASAVPSATPTNASAIKTPGSSVTATGAVAQTSTSSQGRATNAARPSSTCQTSQLSIRLISAGTVTGTNVQGIVFKNNGSKPCALRGYPRVAFVASARSQVGSEASKNTQQAVVAVLIAPGANVLAQLRITPYQGYPAMQCLSRPISGLRVYPPQNVASVYVPFTTVPAACATKVGQLTVGPVFNRSTSR